MSIIQPVIAPVTLPQISPQRGRIAEIFPTELNPDSISPRMVPTPAPIKADRVQESKAWDCSLEEVPRTISLPFPSVCEILNAAPPAVSLSEKYAVSFFVNFNQSFLHNIVYTYKKKIQLNC